MTNEIESICLLFIQFLIGLYNAFFTFKNKKPNILLKNKSNLEDTLGTSNTCFYPI
jgi:hypothetical protein